MIEFLYTGDYTTEPAGSATIEKVLPIHGKLFSYACKYGIKRLQTLTAQKFGKDKKLVITADQTTLITDVLREAYAFALPGDSLFCDALFENDLKAFPTKAGVGYDAFEALINENNAFATAFAMKALTVFSPATGKVDKRTIYQVISNLLSARAKCSCSAPARVLKMSPDDASNFTIKFGCPKYRLSSDGRRVEEVFGSGCKSVATEFILT